MSVRSLGLSAACLLLTSDLTFATELAARARAVLQTHCHRCHGLDGAAKGGFNYVLDRDKLVGRGKVVPGAPADSELYQRVRDGEMPPPSRGRLSKEELLVLRQWIAAGAPGDAAAAPRTLLSEHDLQRRVLEDVQALEPRQRRFVRYLSLAHLASAGRSDNERRSVRTAVSKLVNSLSWHPRISRPTPIDPGATLYRIDLRHYRWTAALWDRLASAYPYRLAADTPEARAVTAATGAELPCVRADWFVATASRPPLYQDLLQLPGTDRALERLLQVDVPGDVQDETAARAGFNDSGVSKNNRLLERHDAAFGAYWRSYDFLGNTGRQNLFEHPLGPAAGATSFAPDGGEVIFNLPNGLFGFLLVDGLGRRVDRAPVEIVSDPKRPDQRVETGLSCMSCHAHGLLFKADQVRLHVEKNAGAFRKADVEGVRALYPSKARLQALLNEDNERYLKALARVGVSADEADPVNAVTLAYEGTLDGPTAAAELGLTAAELAERLRQTPALARVLGPLRLKGGTVQRQTFQEGFAEVARALRLVGGGTVARGTLANQAAPFTGHSGAVLSLALSPDGKRAASGGEDRTLRLWEVATGRELRRVEAHGDVTALAFSADGRRLVVAGADRSVRLWDAETFQDLLRLRGHTDRVRALAVSPDGRLLASGGADRTVRVWDAATGQELHCLTGHARAVTALAFRGGGLLSGSLDGTLRLWDANSGKELVCLEGHTGEVYAAALSPDGRRALSGGNDRTVRLWDVESGRELRRLEGHANAVIAVAFTPDGRRAVSGSSRYGIGDRVLRAWDLDSGRELAAPADQAAVGVLAIAPDAATALSGGPDGALHLWRLAR